MLTRAARFAKLSWQFLFKTLGKEVLEDGNSQDLEQVGDGWKYDACLLIVSNSPMQHYFNKINKGNTGFIYMGFKYHTVSTTSRFALVQSHPDTELRTCRSQCSFKYVQLLQPALGPIVQRWAKRQYSVLSTCLVIWNA